jgi:hypothetical protein
MDPKGPLTYEASTSWWTALDPSYGASMTERSLPVPHLLD